MQAVQCWCIMAHMYCKKFTVLVTSTNRNGCFLCKLSATVLQHQHSSASCDQPAGRP